MNPTFDQALARLRAQYLARLPQHLSLLQELLSEPDTAQKRREAKQLAHRLKGSSGSHGLHKLSQGLGRLEAMLINDSGTPLSELRAILSSAEDLPETLPRDAPNYLPFPAADQDAGVRSSRVISNRPQRGSNVEGSAQESVEPQSGDAPAKSGRVLLLELETKLAQRCSDLLKQHAVEVFISDSLEEAEEIATRGWLDFVLLQASPQRSVGDTVQRLREAASNCWLPIGTFSAESSVRQHQQAASAGVDVFLSATAPDAPIQEAFDQLFERSNQIAPKLLLVDDDTDILRSLETVLSLVGMRTRSLSNPTRILETLDAWDPDALVVDVDMPELRGNEVCSILRSSPRWQSLPVIMLTGSIDRATRLACYRAGCDDFICKPYDQEELVVRIQARVARKRVQMRSERDPLSGLILRRPFSLRSHMRTSEARRHRVPLSMCMLDLDHFKLLNDRHGHLAGDRVISTLGRLLRSRLREEDIAARWGGEEFAIALPHTDAASAHHVVVDILEHLSAVEFVGDSGEPFRTTFSAGVSTYPNDGDSLELLLAVADRRLYEAKHAGRARVSSQPPGMDDAS